MEHGGVLSFTHGAEKLLYFSCNINPLGMPNGLKRAIIKNYNIFSMYPDIKYMHLKNRVAQYLSCPPKNVILGNGTVELIDSFCALAERVIICPPCFSEYGLRAKNKPVIAIPYLADFLPNIKKIVSVIKKGDVLFLGNPNNPTGLRLKKEEMLELYAEVKVKNTCCF